MTLSLSMSKMRDIFERPGPPANGNQTAWRFTLAYLAVLMLLAWLA